jgi:light-regulated signal transduction histidine kinase (bacteriophytochrome)
VAAYVDDRLPAAVIGDAARLRQVLLNLAGNAIKFTSSGGVALIVEPGIWPNEISFLVRDTGIGIAPEARERIFPRVRAGRRQDRPQLWRHRAWPEHLRPHRQAHGRPHHAGEPAGAGSTFEVSIPLAAADGEQTSFARPISPASRSCWSRHRASRPR